MPPSERRAATISDRAIRSARPRERSYKIAAGLGLYLEVMPTGSKLWRFRYRRAGRENRLSLGRYPDVTLAEARDARDAARRLLTNGTDPSAVRRAEQRAGAETFEAVAREYQERRARALNASHAARNLRRLERFVFPRIGALPVAQVRPPAILECLQKIERRGTVETAHRVRYLIGQVMRYAVATGRAERDWTADLKGAIAPAPENHFAAVTNPDEVGALARMIWHYPGEPTVAAALRLGAYLFVRPGELRAMRWADLDLDRGEWRFDASKTGAPHLVPLAHQVVSELEALRPITGSREFVFCSLRGERPISPAALTAALRRLGVDTRTVHTAHGWRATARTLLAERLGFAPEVIELQLAHAAPGPLGATYNRTKYLAERRRMMCLWADYLDRLRKESASRSDGRRGAARRNAHAE